MTRPASKAEGRGLALLVASEALAALGGFVVLMRVARRLGPEAFSGVEWAGAVAGVMLVWVRGGVESIAWREAARRPRLVRPIAEALLLAKLAMAALGLAAIAGIAALGSPQRAAVLLAGGLVLVSSALTIDVGPRALGWYRAVAAVQALRSAALVLVAWLLVRGSGRAVAAAGLAAMAESVAAVAFGVVHGRRFGAIRLRWRGRAAGALLRRGAVASLARSGRVFLYAADLLILAAIVSDAGVGPFAAARRVVFALIGLGLAVPAAVAPRIARDWASGMALGRDRLGRETARLLGPALAASVGLMLTAPGWMAALFGPAYREGGPALALIAARMPLVLLAATAGAALVSIGRERDSLRVTAWACVLAIALIPPAALLGGPLGAAWGMLGVELFASAAGWLVLWRRGAAPMWPPLRSADLRGCGAMAAVVICAKGSPVWVASALGAAAFGIVRLIPMPGSAPAPSLVVEAAP